MTCIVTGDIINSRNVSVDKWLPIIKLHFNSIGNTPSTWEIYRGDSFQFEIEPKKAFKFCLLLKASIKTIDNLDIRLAIGIGKKEFNTSKITESNGEVFIHSGFAFDNYLKKQNLAIKTPWQNFDDILNTSFNLALLTIDNWTTTSAEFMKIALTHPMYTQTEIGKLLNVSQASISKTGKRAGFDEILRLDELYRKLIQQKTAKL